MVRVGEYMKIDFGDRVKREIVRGRSKEGTKERRRTGGRV